MFFGGLLVFFLLFSLPMSYIKVGWGGVGWGGVGWGGAERTQQGDGLAVHACCGRLASSQCMHAQACLPGTHGHELPACPIRPPQHNRVDFVNAEELKVVELRFINGEWRPARIAEPHSSASVAASLGVHASQALTASAASLGKRPSNVHGVELKTDSKRGVLPPAAAAVAAAAGRGATDSAGGGSGGLLHSGRGLPPPLPGACRAADEPLGHSRATAQPAGAAAAAAAPHARGGAHTMTACTQARPIFSALYTCYIPDMS